MQYTVHIYAEIRIPVTIQADSQHDAISQADRLDLGNLGRDILADTPEYTGDVHGYTVDEIGADGQINYENTRHYTHILDEEGTSCY
jgi:hypothetical protein